MWLSSLKPLINERLLWWRWAGVEEMVMQNMQNVGELSSVSFWLYLPHTTQGFMSKIQTENCIMESTVPFQDWISLKAGAGSLPLQATLTQNLPSKPISGCSHSDIHKKCSILSFKWSFPPCYSCLAFTLVSYWMHSHCRGQGSLIHAHLDQSGAGGTWSICVYSTHMQWGYRSWTQRKYKINL